MKLPKLYWPIKIFDQTLVDINYEPSNTFYMKKIGLFYSFNSQKTANIAKKIIKLFGETSIEAVNIEDADEASFMKFDHYILGVPTWFDGELPNYWDEFLPSIDETSLKGKQFAIFGLGDQVGYPENFCDGIGLMAKFLEDLGGAIIGHVPIEGYEFESSKAQREDHFVGLPLDQENQARLSEQRIKRWSEILKEAFQ